MTAWLIKIRSAFIGTPALPLIYRIPAIAVCILLQQQITFFKTDDYLGLRLNAADLLLPLLGILIIARLALRQDPWPQWRVPYMLLWLLALTALMTFALFKGHHITGEWDRWALINKYIGWYALLAYLGLGSWIGGRPLQEWANSLLPFFIATWVFMLATFMGYLMWVDLQGNAHQVYLKYPLDAMMGNRNAYALLSFSALALITALQIRSGHPRWGFYTLWLLVPMLYSYNASRAGLIILAFLLVVFTILNLKFTLRCILLPLIAGSILTACYFSSFDSFAMQVTAKHIQNSAQLAEIAALDAENAKEILRYEGDQVRTQTYSDAIELWKQHPITGGGLGSFRDYHTEKRGKFSDVIDCTGLWLMAETGVIGLSLFAGLFLMAMWKIYIKIRSGGDPHGIYLGILLMMSIFGIMSLVHELMYTRFLWFFMGLALVLQPEERKSA